MLCSMQLSPASCRDPMTGRPVYGSAFGFSDFACVWHPFNASKSLFLHTAYAKYRLHRCVAGCSSCYSYSVPLGPPPDLSYSQSICRCLVLLYVLIGKTLWARILTNDARQTTLQQWDHWLEARLTLHKPDLIKHYWSIQIHITVPDMCLLCRSSISSTTLPQATHP